MTGRSEPALRGRVALIADTHVNALDGVSGSPWRTNALANDRARAIADAVQAAGADRVAHLGDMVHPTPAQPGFEPAVARFRAIFGALAETMLYTPGNHDIGDKPLDWAPAAVANADSMAAYRRAFGAPFHATTLNEARLIFHCSPIVGSGLPEDAEQWAWLEAELAANRGRRLFLFTHYPPFLFDPGEPEHYENLAAAPRRRLLALCAEHAVEAVISAHVHTVFYNRMGPTWFYVLPAVSAMRLDYAHLFAPPPGEDQEHGRDDRAKLGHATLDILADGHRLRIHRSFGASRAESAPKPTLHAAAAPPPRALGDGGGPLPIGADLRGAWAHPAVIPYTGVVDEFSRKRVRNDYLTLALAEIGARRVRTPAQDLLDDAARPRLALLADAGVSAQLFHFGPPPPALAEALAAHRGVVQDLEIIARADALEAALAAARPAAEAAGARLIASRLLSSADLAARAAGPSASGRFTHFIAHGFSAAESPAIAELIDKGLADGAVLRAGPGEAPSALLGAETRAEPGALTVYLTLHDADPARRADDDAAIAARVLEAAIAAAAAPGDVTVITDTLIDLDRGYFPRRGLYSARLDPRPAAKALAALAGVYARYGAPSAGSIRRAEPVDGLLVLRTDVWDLASPTRDDVAARWPDAPSGAIGVGLVSGRRIEAGAPIDEPTVFAPS